MNGRLSASCCRNVVVSMAACAVGACEGIDGVLVVVSESVSVCDALASGMGC